MSGSSRIDMPLPPLPERTSLPADQTKVLRAAREFEAMLIANWLEEVEQGLQSLGGEEESAGADTAQAIALQAISKGVTAGGGFGLAKMLVRYLSQPPGVTAVGTIQQDEVKLSGAVADTNIEIDSGRKK